MTGVGTFNAKILDIAKAMRLLRSQCVSQFRISGPMASCFVFVESMMLWEMPIMLLIELKGKGN